MLLFRVSFTGELGFEINVPADYGAAVWESDLRGRASRTASVEYGTETMHVLRAEKGYIIVGQDTDGTVTPDDAGVGWAVGKTKADFVGKRSLERASMKAPDRKQLVGLRTQATAARCSRKARRSSPTRGPDAADGIDRARDLVLLRAACSASRSRSRWWRAAAPAWARRSVRARCPSGDIEVEVASPIFYDPAGARING